MYFSGNFTRTARYNSLFRGRKKAVEKRSMIFMPKRKRFGVVSGGHLVRPDDMSRIARFLEKFKTDFDFHALLLDKKPEVFKIKNTYAVIMIRRRG